MSLRETVLKLVEEAVVETDIYVVDIVISESRIKRKVSILLDSDAGITIEECTKVSRSIGLQMEEIIEEAFTLEVSSPGADAPLKLNRQYTKSIGRNLKVNLKDGSEVKGQLTEVTETSITIEPEAKKKVKPEAMTLNFDDIKEAKVIISFK